MALKAELKDKEKEMGNIIESIKKGDYKDWMGDLGDELGERIKHIKGKMGYLENLSEKKALTMEEIYNYIMKDSDLSGKGPEDLNQIIKAYVEKVVVFEDRIEIHLIINKNNPGSKYHPD